MRLTALLSMAARVVVPKDYRYGTNRPWTFAAKLRNYPGKRRRKVFVEPLEPEDWTLLKGDRVRNPLSGNYNYLTFQYLFFKCSPLSHCADDEPSAGQIL